MLVLNFEIKNCNTTTNKAAGVVVPYERKHLVSFFTSMWYCWCPCVELLQNIWQKHLRCMADIKIAINFRASYVNWCCRMNGSWMFVTCESQVYLNASSESTSKIYVKMGKTRQCIKVLQRVLHSDRSTIFG